MFERKEKYLNGILPFFVLMSICTGGFYRFPCLTDKPRKNLPFAEKEMQNYGSILAC